MRNLEKTSLLMVLALSALGTSCARKRAVEKMVDVDGNRYAKASFADGRPWLGRVTIVNNGSNSAFGFIGSQSEVKLGTFQFTKDKLQYVTDNGLVKSGEVKVINEWDITHSEYHRRESGGRVSNVETENDLIPWNEKKYFKVNWESALVTESITFPYEVDERCWIKKASRVVPDSMEVDAEHINFVVEVDYQVANVSYCIDARGQQHNEFAHTMRYMYSFVPDKVSDYKPYVYAGENDPLIKKYGYFLSSSPFLNKNGQAETTFYMNRWITGKTHTFYFAEGFPEKYKWVYNDPEKGVIARTNKLFADNGIDLKFEVKDADAQHKFGDIRYSFFNWISADDDQAPLGYGPATAHPLTGEIISANTTMWTSSLQYYLQRMADKEIIIKDRDKTSALYKKISTLLETPSDQWTASSSFLDDKDQAGVFRYLLPDFTYGNEGNQFANLEKTVQASQTKTKLQTYWETTGKKSGEYETANLEVANARQNYFQAELDNLKKTQSRSTVWYLNDAMFNNMGKVIDGKSEDEIINDILYRTAIHEFGHNLNLRHNFYGSVDAASRRATAVPGKKYATTSVMDYLDLESEVGTDHDWEDYDRAALLYAYSNGTIDKINENGDPYLYCTDEHTYSNPLCNRFDSGATATEIVANMIANYEDGYWMRNFRYGREFWTPYGYARDVFGTMYNMKKFLTFSDQAFTPAQINRNLTVRPDLSAEIPGVFAKNIGADMEQAVKLVAAFYTAVIQQDASDRPFQNTYDPVSGALTRHGIMWDKIIARDMLLGEDGISIDPNHGHLVTSFFNLLGNDKMKTYINGLLNEVYIDAGQMYVGYEESAREVFISSAAGLLDRKITPTEQTRINCMKEETLVSTFKIDVKAGALDSGTARQITVPADAVGYFKAEGKVNVIYIDGNYYASGLKSNSLGANLIAKGDARSILSAYRAYGYFTSSGIPECR